MEVMEVFLIAVGLAMDAFAVSVSSGLMLKEIKFKHAFKFGMFFGAFQFIMPVVGWLCARSFKDAIESFDHWIAFILLFIIGGKMFIETFKNEDNNVNKDEDILSVSNMIVLAVATSIDALAVGVGFAFIENEKGINIWMSSAIIGIVAFILSYAGIMLGRKIGDMFQKNAERAGGLVLIGIGIKILAEHLFV